MYDDHFFFDENENKFYSSKGGQSYEDIFKSLEPITKDYIFHLIDDVPVTVSKNSKHIRFIEGESTKNIFVVNANQVLFLLKKFKFKHYQIDGKNLNEININDNLNFEEITYLENLLFKIDYDKANENIEKKEKILLENLSLMYFDYQTIKVKSEFILTEERKDFFKKLYDLNQTKRFIPIYGPKSIGKTTSLLYYLKVYTRLKYFYINLKYCQKLISLGKKEELLLCICKELFNCMKFEDVKILYNVLKKNNYINVMDIVLDIFRYMRINFPFNKFYIVLDQYKEKIDINYRIVKEIKIMTKLYSNFDVFVCSSINEFDFRNSLNKRLENSDDFYLNYLFINKLISVKTELMLKELNDEEIKLLNESGDLFLYFYKIRDNRLYKGLPIEETKKEIMNHIIEKINDYFSENDNKRKISIIREIHDIIKEKKKLIEFKDKLSLIPFKYFNISINDQNMFIIEDLNEDTEIIIDPCYPIVIDCINQIFQNSKYELKRYSTNNTTENNKISNKSNELEENFNDYLWFYKNKFYFHECQIIKKIKITSLLELNESDGETIKRTSQKLKNINESILITQQYKKARHYDTAILKLIKIDQDEIKFFELYLFKETLKKEAKDRLFNLILIEDGTILKLKLYLKSEIKIKNIYFSYVFDKYDLDSATIKYCQDLNINYQIYDDTSPNLIDSNINSLIKPKFEFPLQNKCNLNVVRQEYILDIIDIDFSQDHKILIKENEKLDDFLKKKRQLKKAIPGELSSKIKKSKIYVNNYHRNYEIEETLIQEHLMKDIKGKLVGITYLIDKETKGFLAQLNFNKKEKDNLFSLMKNYNNKAKILKIIKLNGFISINMPNYDCCILQVNSKKEKIFIDLKKKISYSLKDKAKRTSIELAGDFYLIKFSTKNMIFEE